MRDVPAETFMAKCPECARENPEDSRFCASCGEALNSEVFATRTVVPSASPGSRRSPIPRSSSSSSTRGESRFLPGTLLASRFRIVSLLGKGGMGEVYRADDLTLDQQVALKFLPENVTHNEQALERFRGEVRIARQVSHKNVCRLYDLGDHE